MDHLFGVSNCLKKSSGLSGGHAPRCATRQHRIENREQLPHAGRQRQLLRLARLTQALVERPNRRIPARGDQRRHIERASDVGKSAPDGSPTFERAAIPWKRSHAR